MYKKISVSICIITKNECSMLKECLTHIKPYADAGNHEIVIVDTGSTDDTVEICRSFTDNIYFFEWINDFSAARNFAASKASNDWILCIDSDENVSVWDEENLQKFINTMEHKIGGIIQSNLCGFGDNQYLSNDRASRLYHRKYFYFDRSIHEQLEPFDPSDGHHYVNINIVVQHMAYSGTADDLRAKSERNITLLKAELEKKPHDAYVLFQLGQSYYMIEDFETAEYYYGLGLSEDVDPRENYVNTMLVSYGYTLLNLKKYKKALELEGVYDTFSNRADYVFLMGMIYMNNGFLDDAVAQFEKATTYEECEVVGANSFRAYHNLGVIYECAGYIDKAIQYYRKCGDFKPSVQRLKELTNSVK